jgi:hypothetical protein
VKTLKGEMLSRGGGGKKTVGCYQTRVFMRSRNETGHRTREMKKKTFFV